jgi:chromate transporter
MNLPVVLDLLLHFASLSMLAIGGAMVMTPEMHRYLVDERGWLSAGTFNDAIAIAQAAPGPNILFVMLLGWQVAGTAGAVAAIVGTMLPSSVATFLAWRWKLAREDATIVAAIRLGLSPIAIGLTASAGFVIAGGAASHDPALWGVSAAAAVVTVVTRLNLLWLVGAGALLGILGVVG